jgi:hypothetical protein
MSKATKKTPTTPATITLPTRDPNNPRNFAKTAAAAPVEQVQGWTEVDTDPNEYERTPEDVKNVADFITAAKTYGRASNTFAVAAYRMMLDGLHIREGFENFGQWCAFQFKKHEVVAVEARRAYQLAQIGELLETNGNSKELAALPSRALLTMAQNEAQVNKRGGAQAVAEALPQFMKEQKIGDTAAALSELLAFGMEGDQRTREMKKADAQLDSETNWFIRGNQLCRMNYAKAEQLTKKFLDLLKIELEKKEQKTERTATRSSSRRTE